MPDPRMCRRVTAERQALDTAGSQSRPRQARAGMIGHLAWPEEAAAAGFSYQVIFKEVISLAASVSILDFLF